MQKLVILGGGNAFWEISELINDINVAENKYEIISVLDDNKEIIGKKLNEIFVDGPLEKAKDFPEDVKFVFAIGSFRTRIIRASVLSRLNIPDSRYETLIHPRAKVFSTAKIGYGCIIHFGTIIFNHSILESFTVAAANNVIGVSNLLGRGCLLASNITTTTGVKIGCFSFVGSSSSIGEGCEIGPGAMVGMGSLINKNIPAGVFVFGNPPRFIEKTEVSENIIVNWEKTKKHVE